MESLEVSAKTVEEAIERGLDQLGLSREEIEVTVLKQGKSGFLGMGAEEALVRLTSLVPIQIESSESNEGEVGALAKGVLEEILSLMKLNATVELKPPLEEASVKTIALEVKGDDLGILIGRHGETLTSLQYILKLIIAHRQKAKIPLTIDVEGYKQRRYQALRELALNLAKKAKATGQSVTLEPMPADERRIVHLALSVNPEITTQSVGEGEVRKVVILPRKR